MKFCKSHWDLLRKAIDDRGLSHLVPRGGENAIKALASQISRGKITRQNFDPLMGAHWAIAGNVMDTLRRAGLDPLYLMLTEEEEAPLGRSTCPLCEINLLHREGCTNPKCVLDKERGYDWMIDRAADDALNEARRLGLAPKVQ